MNMRLGRTAFNCYSVIMVFRGCITFIKWQEKVAEAILEKNQKESKWKLFYMEKGSCGGLQG